MTNNSVTYLYAHGDLLENRHTYQYSKYYGKKFLEAWKENRNEALSALGASIHPPGSETSFQADQRMSYPLKEHLDELYSGLNQDLLNNLEFRQLLHTWVKKFEITKRLFSEYDRQFKPLNKNGYHDLSIYLRYAEVMESAYTNSNELPFLNVLLKVMDTLIASRNKLTEVEKKRLSWLIQQEKIHINQLCLKRGVSI